MDTFLNDLLANHFLHHQKSHLPVHLIVKLSRDDPDFVKKGLAALWAHIPLDDLLAMGIIRELTKRLFPEFLEAILKFSDNGNHIEALKELQKFYDDLFKTEENKEE